MCAATIIVRLDAKQDEKDAGNKHRKRPKKQKARPMRNDGIVAFDLGIKMLATGVNDRKRFYRIGGFKSYRWHNKQLNKIRSKRVRCKKQSRRYIHVSNFYKRVTEKKRRKKQQDCLHKEASHLIAHRLAEKAVVIGDLSQQQIDIRRKESENLKEHDKWQ